MQSYLLPMHPVHLAMGHSLSLRAEIALVEAGWKDV